MLEPLFGADLLERPRQELDPIYAQNGAIFVMGCRTFLEHKIFYVEQAMAYEMPAEASIDIDTAADLVLAEHLLARAGAAADAKRIENQPVRDLNVTMEIYPRDVPLNEDAYRPGANVTETFYGLPGHVDFCTSCVISNQRPNSVVEFTHTRDSTKTTIHMHDDGGCDACKTVEEKHATDWDARRAEMEALCDRYRRDDGHYDCLMSGSGGKDSFYASHVLKTEFGMHPLTVTWAPHVYTDWGWQNFQSWIHAGFDNYFVHPQRPHPPAADAVGGGEPVPPVPALYSGAKESGAQVRGENSASRSFSMARTKRSTATPRPISRTRSAAGNISPPRTNPRSFWVACPSRAS